MTKRLTPTQRKVLEYVHEHGSASAQPIMDLLWGARFGKYIGTDRLHGYRRRAGTVLADYERRGWLTNTGFRYAVGNWVLTTAGRIALEADRKAET